jgi:hypothetical protein
VGRVYLDGGHVEHVVSVREGQETTGVRGLGRLLDLEDVDFQVLPYRPPSRRTVHVPTAAALTEAARLIDEQRRDGALLDAVQAQCPEASGVAVGYAPSERPAETRGDGTVAFGLALRALDALRPLAGRVSHLAVEGEGRAIAALRFGDGARALRRRATRPQRGAAVGLGRGDQAARPLTARRDPRRGWAAHAASGLT